MDFEITRVDCINHSIFALSKENDFNHMRENVSYDLASEDQDQPAHARNLIGLFAVREVFDSFLLKSCARRRLDQNACKRRLI